MTAVKIKGMLHEAATRKKSRINNSYFWLLLVLDSVRSNTLFMLT